MSDSKTSETLCERVDNNLIEIVQGEAPEDLYDHIADCDRCRDLQHDAERARDLAIAAGADFVLPDDLVARVHQTMETQDAEAGEAPELADGAAVQTDVQESESGPTADQEEVPDDGVPSRADKVASLPERRRPGRAAGIALFGAALAAAAIAVVIGDPSPEQSEPSRASMAWQGTVTKVSRAAGGSGGLTICDASGEHCAAAGAAALVPTGSVLRTDDRTRAYFDLGDGTRLALDRSTELRFDASSDRSAALTRGAIVAEVTKVDGKLARVSLPRGYVEVLGTKFALRQSGEVASVDVSRGSVRLVDEKSREVVVRAGEEGRSYAGAAPYAIFAPALGEALSWSESDEEESASVRGLGELKAKKPGSDDERDGAVTLSSHKVKVRIVDGFARTEIDEVFTNSSNEVLEGIYRFPLPPDAQIERLALEVDGELKEGAFLDRERAAKIWRGAIVNATGRRPRRRDEIIWVPGPWKDPALLEWQRGGRFELRIFPIPKKGSRRIVLTYTQVLQPTGSTRRYVYPLAHDESGSTRVGRFDVDVELRGHNPAAGVSVHGYAVRSGGDSATHKLTMHREQFVPTGDLVIEYGLPAAAGELRAWAYAPSDSDAGLDAKDGKEKKRVRAGAVDGKGRGDQQAYVAMTLQPKLPRLSDDAHRAYGIVIDASRSMFGERYRRASKLAARLVRELDRFDRFTVLACDTQCRRMDGAWLVPGAQAAAGVKAFLSGVTPEGASDPAAALREAAAMTTEGRALRVVYIGDGTPTTGPIRPRYLTTAVQQATAGGRATVTAVAIGVDADLDALGAMARGGGGVVLPYVPGQRVSDSAFAILGATYGMGLRDVKLQLPDGLVEVAPRKLDTIPAGGQALVVARMDAPRVSGTVVLTGKVGDAPFEQRYPIDVRAVSGQANAFVPRLYAAARIADLERAGGAAARKQAVALSSRFNVASRYTSLLVLESAAMFRAFGLDNSRRAPVWTGQALADASTSPADKEQEDPLSARGNMWGDSIGDSFGAGGLGLSGFGMGGGGRGKSSAPASRKDPKPVATSPPLMGAPGDLLAREPMRRRPPPRRPMIPMRRIWERTASLDTARVVPHAAASKKITEAEAELGSNENRRAALQKLYNLYALAGRIDDAERLATRWSNKDALDPDALRARADVAARRGEREAAIRILGSVIDVRPDEVAAHQRLARLHRWAGRSALACRHRFAVAQLRVDDVKAVAPAVRCLRETGEALLAEDLLSAVAPKVRTQVEAALRQAIKPDKVRGEVRLTATWQGGAHDLDVALVHQSG
ncbi:MAG: VIT domain-containing protein, partial [Polyangiaceae bacterium]